MKNIILLILCFLISYLSFAREFDINEFIRHDKYGWNTLKKQKIARENLNTRQKLLQIYDVKKQSPARNMIKSIFVPGWGHFSAGSYTKGEILLGLEIIFIGSSLFFYDQAMDNFDKYKNATYIEDINKYYDDAKVPYGYSQGFLGLGIIVWLYTIYDSMTVTDNYNQNLWQNIFFEYQNKTLSITPTGISLRF